MGEGNPQPLVLLLAWGFCDRHCVSHRGIRHKAQTSEAARTLWWYCSPAIEMIKELGRRPMRTSLRSCSLETKWNKKPWLHSDAKAGPPKVLGPSLQAYLYCLVQIQNIIYQSPNETYSLSPCELDSLNEYQQPVCLWFLMSGFNGR